METSRSSIPISLIRQHCFCPRIPWFNEVKNLNPGNRMWQRQGTAFHDRQRMLSKRRNLSRFGLQEGRIQFDIELKSAELGCHGICDGLVLTADEVVTLDFKLSGRQPSRGQILQTAAYGMLAEIHYDIPCQWVFILIGKRGRTYRFSLSDKRRQEVVSTIDRIRGHFNTPILPHSSASDHQCGQCEYFNFCADR